MNKNREEIIKDYKSSSKSKGHESFIMVYKVLIKKLGPIAAILYSDLYSKALYFTNQNTLDSQGYFFNTFENISEDLSFSPHQIREGLKKLKEVGLIDYLRKGHPPKYYFILNIDTEKKFFEESENNG